MIDNDDMQHLHRFFTLVLVIVTLFFLLTVWRRATAPDNFAERLGLTVANAGGHNEIRAQYAGFFLAVANILSSIACWCSITSRGV
jgi:hypothetical protein